MSLGNTITLVLLFWSLVSSLLSQYYIFQVSELFYKTHNCNHVTGVTGVHVVSAPSSQLAFLILKVLFKKSLLKSELFLVWKQW